jgi:hypothetical protein
MVMPKDAPTGAPAENVAKAKDRIREGGKAWARMPSWSDVSQSSGKRRCGRTDAGMLAAEPAP